MACSIGERKSSSLEPDVAKMDGRVFECVSLNSIYCIVVSSLLFSPSIYKSCFVIRLQLPPPRLVYKLFAGGKVM